MMSQSSKILGCLLLVGWATSAIAESEKTLQQVSSWRLPRKELATFVKNLQSSRHKRSPEGPCPVTDEVAQDEMMPTYYTPEQLRTCLEDDVLVRHLRNLSYYPFVEDQLPVIKEKLDKMYPEGYPDSVIRNLGDFMSLMGPEDIKKWRFSSSETLASLLKNSPSPEWAKAIIRQYTDSGGPLNAAALNVINPNYICLLDSDQLEKIDENAIKGANPLHLSSCNQTTKDILCPKITQAFLDEHNSLLYDTLNESCLERAPAEVLKALSKVNVNMDIDTFMKLRKDAMMGLTPSEVEGLLGKNLPDLKKHENNPPVKEWIATRKQSELNKMPIRFEGGTPEGYMNIPPRNNN